MKRRLLLLATMIVVVAVLVPMAALAKETPHSSGVALAALPTPVVIDGITTYGHSAPLGQSDVNALIAHWNSPPATKLSGTFYGTEFVWYDEYTSIPPGTGDTTYQQFLKRHNEKLDEVVKNAHPLLDGFVTRRLLRVQDGVSVSWWDPGIKDSDGGEGLWFYRPYEPWLSGYWDSTLRIDRGRLHEQGHKVLRLPDVYRLEADFNTAAYVNLSPAALEMLLAEVERYGAELADKEIAAVREAASGSFSAAVQVPLPLVDVPTAWRRYWVDERNDARGGSLMTDCSLRLCSYTTWILARRVAQEWSHDLAKTEPEAHRVFPNELASRNTLVFGEGLSGATIEIWRTSGDDLHKDLQDKVFSGRLDHDGAVAVGNLFAGVALTEDGLVPGYQGLLFVKVRKPNNETWWRWIDIGDFSVGLGPHHPYPCALRMTMGLANVAVTPSTFDWAISYEGGPCMEFVPAIKKAYVQAPPIPTPTPRPVP